MKKCFKCGEEKPLSEFYRHKQMVDGHLNKCKSCTKKDSTENRNANIEKIRAYDRGRGNRQAPNYIKHWRESNPEKWKCHIKLNNELRKENITRKPCEVCGTTDSIHGHHDDYSKPLDVRWLCAAHHKQLHTKQEEE